MLPSLPESNSLRLTSVIEQLAEIPKEEIWLAKQKSARTRRAYRLDVRHFMAVVGIISIEQLRRADHRAVIAWERHMREIDRPAINRDEGTTPALAKQDARELLVLPDADTLEGLRDRAILSVGLQVGLRCAASQACDGEASGGPPAASAPVPTRAQT